MTDDPLIGSIVGAYEVLDFIDAGAVGLVYRARDVRTKTEVAFKIIQPELRSDQALIRFMREAKAVERLEHPAIVRLHEVGSAAGHHFITFELLTGPNLEKVVEQDGPLDPVRARTLAQDLLGALEATHCAGMVHRDVEPANVVRFGGVLGAEHWCLIDYGACRDIIGGDGPVLRAEADGTPPHLRFVKLPYTAPELLLGWDADARSDIFGAACVIYEAITGKHPFGLVDLELTGALDDRIHQVTSAVAIKPPKLREVAYWVDEAFSDAIAAALHTVRDERPAGAGVLLEMLGLEVE